MLKSEFMPTALSHITTLGKKLENTSMKFTNLKLVIGEMEVIRKDAVKKIEELYPVSVWLPFRNGYLKDETNYLLKQLDDTLKVIVVANASVNILKKKFTNVGAHLKIDSNEIPGPISLKRSLMIARYVRNEISVVE
ncbi:hypothetical protein HK096_009370 [Nowakowskiella sp. JEL0078]|nr:hypothetical protein HK096_009370 [Nowakowskiella sp. JEL0078]